MPFLMEARSSVDGTIKTWTTDFPDWAGREFPGPGVAQNVAAFDAPSGRRGTPTFLPLDSFTPLRWRFQEAASPYRNDGTRGSAGDMIATTGDGTVFKGGQSDGWFGLGLKWAMDPTANPPTQGKLLSPHFAWPTSEVTVSMWFTPTRTIGANGIGRVIFKARDDATWNDPWYAWSLQYGLFGVGVPNDFSAGMLFGGGVNERAYFEGNRSGVQVNMMHHVGFTWGGGRIKGYLDGYLHSDAATAQAFSLGTGSYAIGTPPSTTLNEYFGGFIHEIRVCTIVRPAAWFRDAWNLGQGRGYVNPGPPQITGLDFDLADTAGGDVVTVYGNNLQRATSVLVGGTSAAVTSASHGKASFAMPAKAPGTYDVQVIGRSGQSNVLANAIEAYSPAQENLTIFVHGPYSGSPWVGRASAGTSGTRNLTQAVPPAVGSPLSLSGIAPASFNGTTQYLDNPDGSNVLHSSSGGTTIVGARALAAFADQGATQPFNNPNLDLELGVAASYSTAGWRAGVHAGSWNSSAIAVPVGNYFMGLLRWTAPGTAHVSVNDGAKSAIALGSTSTVGGGTTWFGRGNAPGNFFTGDVLFVITAAIALPDATITKIWKWARCKFKVFP